jgi:uncharacterized membrane protein YeiH
MPLNELSTLLDLVAIAAGALFGSAVAVQRRAPLVGVMVLGVLMGLGGGIIRDVLLDVRVAALENELFLPVAIGAAFLGLPLARRITEHPLIGVILDGTSLGLYVMVGTAKATLLGIDPMGAILIGVITAIGGGTLVDVMVGERPAVVKNGPWVASAAVAGGALFVILDGFIPSTANEIATVAVVAGLRISSELMGYQAPSVDTLAKMKRRKSS